MSNTPVECTNEYKELLQENERLRRICEETQNASVIYTHIAHALARDYTDLFYVNMETEEFIEYHTDDDNGVLVESRRAGDFFGSCSREAKLFVHPDDQDMFVSAMNRDFLTKTLDQSGMFTMNYRRIKYNRTFYVQMKVSRMKDNKDIIVIAVSDIDELVMKRREEERIQEERIVYARLHAITGNFIVVYVVDPETGHFREFSSIDDYTKSLAQEKEGTGFFDNVRDAADEHVHPADQSRYLKIVTKENIMAEIARHGIFTFGYRFILKDQPIHVQMKAAMVEEKEGPRLVVGLNDIDAQFRQEEAVEKRLVQAESRANFDALTGVRNKHAFLEEEVKIDNRIAAEQASPFAIVMLDLNDLKKINDTAGHQMGDQYLRDACRIICEIFKHSPVFRIGGDEFAVIAQGDDYIHLDDRLEEMRAHNEEASKSGGIVIACGMSKFDSDTCVTTVFERADHNMYENKARLKAGVTGQ